MNKGKKYKMKELEIKIISLVDEVTKFYDDLIKI